MSSGVIIPTIFLWILLVFFLFLMLAIVILIMAWYKEKFSDSILLIGKDNRGELIKTPLKYLKKITIRENTYYLKDNESLPLPNGKVLYVFSEGKPAPYSHNEREWLSGDTIKSMLTNDLLKKMLEANASTSLILMIIAISAGIAALAAAATALKIFGVLK